MSATIQATALDQSHLTEADTDCLRDSWIDYPMAREGLNRLLHLFMHPDSVRTPGLLVYGRSNSGKTMLVNKFKRDSDRVAEKKRPEATTSRVQFIETPPDRPTPRALYREILQSLRAPIVASHSSERLLGQVVRLYTQNSVKMLIVDELHNIARAGSADQAGFLNVLKYLSNKLNIRVVAVGTEEAYRVLQLDPQLGSRFKPFHLMSWAAWDEEYAKLIIQLIHTAGIRPSRENGSKRFVEYIHDLSEGLTGETKDLIVTAAREARKFGKDEIDQKLVESLNWMPPRLRYR